MVDQDRQTKLNPTTIAMYHELSQLPAGELCYFYFTTAREWDQIDNERIALVNLVAHLKEFDIATMISHEPNLWQLSVLKLA